MEKSGLRSFAEHDENGIPFGLKDYLELVDWGGREIQHNKRGYIPANTPPILTRLKMDVSPVLGYLSKDGEVQLQTTQVLFTQRIKMFLFSGYHGVNSFVYARHWANRSLTVDEGFIPANHFSGFATSAVFRSLLLLIYFGGSIQVGCRKPANH